MAHAYICEAIRTRFGRYGDTLSSVRTDDLRAIPIKALMARNRNVEVPGSTVNRLCGSGLDAVGSAARAIKSRIESTPYFSFISKQLHRQKASYVLATMWVGVGQGVALVIERT